ncbi:MAG: hypothetical protein GF308_17120 [Candidatus Heimdallarchaeota archaeon]|nr:hypothetical protein [Candidatus Heimdallarchaeota archaeon]
MISKKWKNSLIISFIIIIVIAGITIGSIFLFRDNNVPRDASFWIFNAEENVAQVSAEEFQALTQKELVISIQQLLTHYEIESFSSIQLVSLNDDYQRLVFNETKNTTIALEKDGFTVYQQEKILTNLLGVVIDVPYMSVDISPTIYQALRFSDWETQGESVKINSSITFEKVVVFLLDGFGWRFWENLTTLGLIDLNGEPFFSQPAVTVFPPITNVGTAALLTGYWPSQNGIFIRQDHQLLVPTLFDIASNNGLTTEFIEGNVGFLNFEADYEHWLVDDEGDGDTDDEIFEETNRSLHNNRSDCLFVHFHGIDDMGHKYGPNSGQWLNKVIETFEMVNELLDNIEEDTLIVLTADHGMHLEKNSANDDYRAGTHGECIWEDMLIPFILLKL